VGRLPFAAISRIRLGRLASYETVSGREAVDQWALRICQRRFRRTSVDYELVVLATTVLRRQTHVELDANFIFGLDARHSWRLDTKNRSASRWTHPL